MAWISVPWNRRAAAQPRKKILVDASRDGGVWWAPQTPPFDSAAPHQGDQLTEYLRSRGYTVTELPRSDDITIDLETLEEHHVVIRANEFGRAYTEAEREAYRTYVRNGNNLLLLSGGMDPGETDSLAAGFELTLHGTSRGENRITRFAAHPVAEGVSSVSYPSGSGVNDYPPGATIIGWLSGDTYLDLNNDGEQDTAEPTGSPVLGALHPGDGQVIFLGDTNALLSVPQPLTENIIDWFTVRGDPVTDSAESTPTATPEPTTGGAAPPSPTATTVPQPPTTTQSPASPDENGDALSGVMLPAVGAGSVGWLLGFFAGYPEKREIRHSFLNLLLVGFGSVGVFGLLRWFLEPGGAAVALLVTSLSWGLFAGLLVGMYLRARGDSADDGAS